MSDSADNAVPFINAMHDLPALCGGLPIRPEGPPSWPLPDEAVADALRKAFANGSWGQYHGRNCRELIERLAAMHGRDHTMLTCSGTAAVELALRGLGIGAGDEVILSAYDFEGNFKNVLAVGAKPVLTDINSRTGQLDVTQLEAAWSPHTKAVIASHLHGGIVDMPAVRAFADQHQLAVVEDAAQMPGAIVHGQVAGTWGDVGILSFGGSKLLTAGRGGALFTHDAAIMQRVRIHTQRGNDVYPLSELQAAVLIPQLEQLAERNRMRAANVAGLLSLLRDVAGLSCFVNADFYIEHLDHKGLDDRNSETRLCTQPVERPDFYKLGFWYDSAQFAGLPRDHFARALRAEGIAFDPGFRALHRTHSRSRFRAVNDLPHATRADESLLVLHHPVLLGIDSDLQQVFQALVKLRDSPVDLRLGQT